MKRLVAVLSILGFVLLTSSASAERLGKGNSMLWVGLDGNRGQFVDPGLNFVPLDGEVGVHLAVSHFLSDSWAGIVSGGFDGGRIRFEAPGDVKLTSRSLNVRVGFDRYAFINDDVALYAGPGLRYWRGRAKVEGDPEYPEVTQVAINGRIGMLARFAPHWALFGHIGQLIGTNSAKEGGSKLTWWTSTHEGSVGLSYDM